jgi:hypothetical protein
MHEIRMNDACGITPGDAACRAISDTGMQIKDHAPRLSPAFASSPPFRARWGRQACRERV